ncbi:acyl-CoA dehydrogenase family protein [Kocuria massiliensis]|uniref:acyl-CoA dehydrogenase family protein n=1 Tax=Kocuria massiliensis TaxID=1926282 RepID=UPI0022B9443E|nr:acyl-CoA dehydrogenase family protein [Kocuria massiliensis]
MSENLSRSLPSEYSALAEHFRPHFERIAQGSLNRDLERDLPFEEFRALEEAGFSTLRVPTEWGGPGVSIETFTRLLIDLAEADSNVAHVYRSHFGFVEAMRFQPRDVQAVWFPRVVAGQTVGNASTERGSNALGSLNTKLTRDSDGWRLNGEKFYTTATIFSDYTRVSASQEGDDADGRRFAIVPIDAEGVTVVDDWDGFGQRLTGTGTTTFDNVRVEESGLIDRVSGSPETIHEAAFFQLVLLAVLAGIARAARRDSAASVARRARTYNTGSGLPFREDPLIQEATGRIAAKAFTAEATVLQAARALDDGLAAAEAAGATSWEFLEDPDFVARIPQELSWSEIAVEHAQITVPELAIGAAQEIFLTGGASATLRTKGTDRHWRNAQTIATHNPIAFRARAVGDYWINGTLPVGLNAIGDATAGSAQRPEAPAESTNADSRSAVRTS